MDDLILPEALLVLMLRDSGVHRASHPAVLSVGAGLAELALQAQVGVEGEGRKARFQLLDMGIPAHPFLATILTHAQAGRGFSRKPANLITAISNKRHVLRPLQQELVEKGVVSREDYKVLGLFPNTRWPLRGSGPRDAILASLWNVIAHNHPADDRIAALIALARAGRLLRSHYGGKALRPYRARIKEIEAMGGPAADATKRAIEAINAAIAASTVVAGGAVAAS